MKNYKSFLKASFTGAWRIFKRAFAVFAALYFIYMFVEDGSLWEKYWKTSTFEYLKTWGVWFIPYSILFSLTYWSIASVVIMIWKMLR